jgi:hypothetical protein
MIMIDYRVQSRQLQVNGENWEKLEDCCCGWERVGVREIMDAIAALGAFPEMKKPAFERG